MLHAIAWSEQHERGELKHKWNLNLGALMWALEKGTMLEGALLFLGLGGGVLPFAGRHVGRVYICVLIGLACGMIIGKITEYFTSFDFARSSPLKLAVRRVPLPSRSGLGVGMISYASLPLLS